MPSWSHHDSSVALHCDGPRIVNVAGQQVVLKGACLGAYLLLENFTNGFPGHEKAFRAAMLKAIGKEKYDFFWQRFYEYFYGDDDARWFASLGLNLQRLAINYRHLQDDLAPGVIKEEGFRYIDRLIEINARHGIYTIVDLHAAPGGQNFDWHSDNAMPEALLWEFRDFQDRTVQIWQAIAARYGSHPWVAGYNLLNEPTDKDPDAARLLAFYTRLGKAVRAVEGNEHKILCFDGNTFGADFRQFDRAKWMFDDNSIYSCHDYSMFGFPIGQPYLGTQDHKDKIKRDFERKIGFSESTNTPIWNGEFGPVFATQASEGDGWLEINRQRLAALKEQLAVYDERRISWTIWLYKDVGVQGMVYASEKSKWWRTFGDRMLRKRELALDFWGTDSPATTAAWQPALDWIQREIPEALPTYPKFWQLKQHLSRRTIYSWLADNMSDWFVEPMKGLSFDELDELAASFKLSECEQRKELVDVLRQHK